VVGSFSFAMLLGPALAPWLLSFPLLGSKGPVTHRYFISSSLFRTYKIRVFISPAYNNFEFLVVGIFALFLLVFYFFIRLGPCPLLFIPQDRYSYLF